MIRRCALALALLAACTDRDPPLDDTDSTTDATDTSDSVPTGDNPTAESVTDTITDTADTAAAEMCGACESIAVGDLSPSSRTALDGFIVATAQSIDAVLTVRGEFRNDIHALAAVYGLPEADVDPAFVDNLIAAIKSDLAANVTTLAAHHVASRCSSNIEVAVNAQAACEANANCDVQLPGDRPGVQCEGLCTGECDAACEGEGSCAVTSLGTACEGLCLGVCEFAAPGECTDVCHGDCLGECAHTDSLGKCAGHCDGECMGLCTFNGPKACDGTCNGTCMLEQGDAACFGAPLCRGACNGTCTGECAGRITSPNLSAACEASAICNSQASAQASATLQCTPPRLELEFVFQAGVDNSARAAFLARHAALTRHSRTILQGTARLDALLTGEVDGRQTYPNPPLQDLRLSIAGILDTDITDLSHMIPAGRLPCVLPALQEAVTQLDSITTIADDTLAAQKLFTTFITNP